MSVEKKINLDLEVAKLFVEAKIKDKKLIEYHKKIWGFATKILTKFYKKSKNNASLKELLSTVIFYEILDYVKTEDLEAKFGSKITQLVFNVTNFEDDDKIKNLYQYEKLFSSYDGLFVKLVLRNAIIHVAIQSLDEAKFAFHIKQYNELRRKVMKSSADLLFLLDYEADLIKYGRNYMSGRSAGSYKYENLITDEG